jgi:hypothetical protein
MKVPLAIRDHSRRTDVCSLQFGFWHKCTLRNILLGPTFIKHVAETQQRIAGLLHTRDKWLTNSTDLSSPQEAKSCSASQEPEE